MDDRTYKRCEYIIRQFMSVEEPTEDLLARFHGWLLDSRHYREKNLVIRRLFSNRCQTRYPARFLSEYVTKFYKP